MADADDFDPSILAGQGWWTTRDGFVARIRSGPGGEDSFCAWLPRHAPGDGLAKLERDDTGQTQIVPDQPLVDTLADLDVGDPTQVATIAAAVCQGMVAEAAPPEAWWAAGTDVWQAP